MGGRPDKVFGLSTKAFSDCPDLLNLLQIIDSCLTEYQPFLSNGNVEGKRPGVYVPIAGKAQLTRVHALTTYRRIRIGDILEKRCHVRPPLCRVIYGLRVDGTKWELWVECHDLLTA